jgi:hypothetical protein
MDERAPIHAIEPARVAGGLGKELLEGARFAVDDDRAVVAYMLVALLADGTTACSGGTDFGDDTPLNSTIFVHMVTEATREHFITRQTARSIVNRANGYDD